MGKVNTSMIPFPLHIPLTLFYYNYYCSWLFYVHHSKLKAKVLRNSVLGRVVFSGYELLSLSGSVLATSCLYPLRR